VPYIAIKAYPKDEETKKCVAEKINLVFLKNGVVLLARRR